MKGLKTLTCEFCSYNPEAGETYDHNNDGWWCDMCDSFTYFDNKRNERDQYLVILEDKMSQAIPKTGAYKHLKKNISPLRYPGGKSLLINYLYEQLYKNKSETLYSPFCGGSSFELSMLDAGVVKKLVLNDLDYGVYSLFWNMLYMPEELIYRIKHTLPTHADYKHAQSQIKGGFEGLNTLDAGWATLLVNRLAYSGISKANALGGKNGTAEQLLSRWNPKKLEKSILHIAQFYKQIELHCENAFDFMVESYWDDNGTIFLDPPYIEKGAALYNIAMTQMEHEKLSTHLNLLYSGCPGANIIVTYDFNKSTESMFKGGSENIVIGRNYSI